MAEQKQDITAQKPITGTPPPSSPLKIGSADQLNAMKTSGLPVLKGWQLVVTISALSLALLLSALETSIIATALPTISSALGHFEKSSWVVVAYFLTYTGFLIIFGRLSDIFGRKQSLLLALGFFTVWSAACGWSGSIEQLIVFRALQGIGGSGIYALCLTAVTEITPLEYMSYASGAVSGIALSASILGPVLGGVITSGGDGMWRWVFWLNIPSGVLIIALILLIFPLNINQVPHTLLQYFRIDYVGVLLSLAGSIMLVFALEQGGAVYAWSNATIIASFIVAGISWVVFVGWEWRLTSREGKGESKVLPIFPMRLVKERVIAASLLSAFFAGFPFIITIINLPQRLQIVNLFTPVDAGIRMLPLLCLSAVGAAFTGAVCSKKNYSFYLLILSNILQMVGAGLMTTLDTGGEIESKQYGYQAILGFGFGMGLTSLIIISRVEVREEDVAVTMAAITQVRVLGGVIGLAIAQALLISTVRSRLSSLLSPEQIQSVLESTERIRSLPAEEARMARMAYAEAGNQHMFLALGMAGASLLAAVFCWRKQRVEFRDLAIAAGANRTNEVGERETKDIEVRCST